MRFTATPYFLCVSHVVALQWCERGKNVNRIFGSIKVFLFKSTVYLIHFHAFHRHFWCAQRGISAWSCGRLSREMFCRCFAESWYISALMLSLDSRGWQGKIWVTKPATFVCSNLHPWQLNSRNVQGSSAGVLSGKCKIASVCCLLTLQRNGSWLF